MGENKFNTHYFSGFLRGWKVSSTACKNLPLLTILVYKDLPATRRPPPCLLEPSHPSSHSFATTGLFQLHPMTHVSHGAVSSYFQYLQAKSENTINRDITVSVLCIWIQAGLKKCLFSQFHPIWSLIACTWKSSRLTLHCMQRYPSSNN